MYNITTGMNVCYTCNIMLYIISCIILVYYPDVFQKGGMIRWMIHIRLTTTGNPLEPGNTLLCATVKYQNDENAYCVF